MRGTDACTGLHGHHTLDGHGHVDQHAIALLHAARLERIGELADAGKQLFVSDLGDLAAVGFEDDGRLVLHGRAHVLVQAVGAGVEFAVGKPLKEWCIGFVERLGERLGPLNILARQSSPEALEVFFRLLAKRLVSGHTGHVGSLHKTFGRREHTVFHQHGLNGAHIFVS
ncbi:hypothetical protein SDC9_115609 [bioreactor metagenome]|uniref:Uncharacterized protein n=1 Tax=bioreactor metagenome TaxID=1076179 RepID=A0A645BTM0_9ZZZZ